MLLKNQSGELNEATSEIGKYDLIGNEGLEDLDELVEIAAAIFDVPIALITIQNGDEQFFIAKKGTEKNSIPLKDSFCEYTLKSERPVLKVSDTSTDTRFSKNPHVIADPYIHFYIGAPLETPRGIRIGTVCLMDQKPHVVSPAQERAVMLISKKIVRHLERRKVMIEKNKQIEFDQQRLRFLTDNVPGAIFQLDYSHVSKAYSFSFISAGISELHPALKPQRLKADPFLLSALVHPEDKEHFLSSIVSASREALPWLNEFRLLHNEGSTWIRGIAVPRRHHDITEWYGVFENVDYLKEYQITLEEMAFDISHGLRKPVSNLLGLVEIFEKDKMSKKDNENFKMYVKEVSVELEKFTKDLNQTYSKKRTDLQDMISKTQRFQG